MLTELEVTSSSDLNMASSFITEMKLDELTTENSETIARIVDATCSLNYGEVTQIKYTPREEDLEFLSRIRYNGSQVFEKCISKYKLGIKMIRDGIPIEKVRELEYANKFSYNGINYSWPENSFKLKCKIKPVRLDQ